METREKTAATIQELESFAADPAVDSIVVRGFLDDAQTLRLRPGTAISGENAECGIGFAAGSDGIQLSTDNRVRNLNLRVSPGNRAIFNDTSVAGFGRFVLKRLAVTGRIQLLAKDNVRGGHVVARDIDIVAADATGQRDRPNGYGVDVLQGAFTLWNIQSDESVTISADLVGLSAGRAGAPVLGSGIFVSGGGDAGGRMVVSRLETNAVYSDGKIPPGTPNQITGGVFTVYGAYVDVVRNRGPVVTYGVNDMVLDNWGVVDRWIAEDKITSHGPSGIGFVNFGIIDELKIKAPIETFGQGARGFNVYTGTVNRATFERITTHGDGSVGIQISKPVGSLMVRRGIETFGGTGPSLVKGVVVNLSAIGLSVKPGGSAREIDIRGGIRVNGAGIAPIEIEGEIETFRVTGGIVAAGGEARNA